MAGNQAVHTRRLCIGPQYYTLIRRGSELDEGDYAMIIVAYTEKMGLDTAMGLAVV
jgi:hypothetical protein